MTESDIVRDCLQWLHAKGIFAWRQNQGAIPLKGGGYRAFNGMRGISDIIGCLGPSAGHPGGRWLACEVKKPGKKPTADQDAFLDRITSLGGVACWVTSVEELQNDLAVVLGS